MTGTSKAPVFAGFPPHFFGFFEELAANNSRDWIHANKSRDYDILIILGDDWRVPGMVLPTLTPTVAPQ